MSARDWQIEINVGLSSVVWLNTSTWSQVTPPIVGVLASVTSGSVPSMKISDPSKALNLSTDRKLILKLMDEADKLVQFYPMNQGPLWRHTKKCTTLP